jgi:hypothetical protein
VLNSVLICLYIDELLLWHKQANLGYFGRTIFGAVANTDDLIILAPTA